MSLTNSMCGDIDADVSMRKYILSSMTVPNISRLPCCSQSILQDITNMCYAIQSIRNKSWTAYTKIVYLYRPQRSCGQGYVFTRVCDSVHKGGGLPQCMLGYHHTHLPGTRHPPGKEVPPGRKHPLGRKHPPPEGSTPRKDAPPAYGQ